MAKFGNYFGLCPLIDYKSLLGISEDERQGNVIVTLGKNLVIVYRLSDQKQVCSWNTKEKFTSKVVFDPDQSKYVAVFNQSYIKMWTAENESLDKLKKFKFSARIHSLMVSNKTTFLLFENGAVSSLNAALENKKSTYEDVVSKNAKECIKDVFHCTCKEYTHFGLLVTSENRQQFLYYTKVSTSSNTNVDVVKIPLDLDGINLFLRGYSLHCRGNTVSLLTLWSDGRLFSYTFEQASQIPGELIGIVDTVSYKDDITMVPLDQNYVAMYGADRSDEGAILIIYNIQFKVTQSKQPFKLFTRGAKLWNIGQYIFLPVGQNLAVVPFHLDTEQLAALIGSHKIVENNSDSDVSIIQELQVAEWSEDLKADDSIPVQIKNVIKEFAKQGYSENTIIDELVPAIIEKKDIQLLKQLLNFFSDIPEKCIVKLLNFLLSAESKVFQNSNDNTSSLYPEKLQPNARCLLLCSILSRPFSDVLLLPHLRTDLKYDHVLNLLNFICYLLSEDGCCFKRMSYVETEARLIEWTCALLDANYQQFLLTKDEDVIKVLIHLTNIVKEELICLEDIRKTIPLLKQTQEKKTSKTRHLHNVKYSIEKLSLY